MVEPYPAPGVARLFLKHSGIPEGSRRSVACLFSAHAGGDVLGYLLFEMKLNLIMLSFSASIATEQSLQPEPESLNPQHDISLLRRFYYQVDCCGQATPILRFLLKLSAPRGGQRIELGLPARFRFFPLGFDPRFLFETVQGRVERALLDLKHLARNLLNAFGNRPAVFRFERDSFQDEKVERSLDQIVWLRHTMVIYNKYCRLSRYGYWAMVAPTTLGRSA